MPKNTGSRRRGQGHVQAGQDSIQAGSGLSPGDRTDDLSGNMRVPGGMGGFVTHPPAGAADTRTEPQGDGTVSGSGAATRTKRRDGGRGLGEDRVPGGQKTD
jgi:hypothetical protein